MTADDDLSRLTAGLDRDEQLARAAAGRAAEWESDGGSVAGGPFEPACPEWGILRSGEHTIVYDEGWPLESEANHIAHHDPARVLERYVPAIRRVIEAEMGNLYEFDQEWGDGCQLEDIQAGRCTDRGAWANSKVLAALASIYDTEDHT